MAELVTTFEDTGDTFLYGIKALETASLNFMPKIATDLRGLVETKMVDPFLAFVDGGVGDCSFLQSAWTTFLEGTCYTFGGGIASFSFIYTICAGCAFALVLLLFCLWRHFVDMFEAAEKDGTNTTAAQREAFNMPLNNSVASTGIGRQHCQQTTM